eukprot:1211023-Rhodomonas_salina.1
MEGDDFLVRARSSAYSSRKYAKHIASAIRLTDDELELIKKVLKRVCQECNLQHAEVLYPTPTGMVITEATWSAGQREEDFHARSTEFIFPLQVSVLSGGMPARVLQTVAD